jgi:hypothetical protein
MGIALQAVTYGSTAIDRQTVPRLIYRFCLYLNKLVERLEFQIYLGTRLQVDKYIDLVRFLVVRLDRSPASVRLEHHHAARIRGAIAGRYYPRGEFS